MQKTLTYLVDDNEVSLLLWSDMLGSQDFECISFTSGEEALRAINLRIPDLVILDVLMPGMDGFEVCQAIRAIPEMHLVPVLMVTSMTDRAAQKKSLEVGANDFLVKPVLVEDLLSRCSRLVEWSSMQKSIEQTHSNDGSEE